jgi:hypothetical protein
MVLPRVILDGSLPAEDDEEEEEEEEGGVDGAEVFAGSAEFG